MSKYIYYIWLPGRTEPIELPADRITWTDGVVRLYITERDANGNVIKTDKGEPQEITVGVFYKGQICGFTRTDKTIQY